MPYILKSTNPDDLIGISAKSTISTTAYVSATSAFLRMHLGSSPTGKDVSN